MFINLTVSDQPKIAEYQAEATRRMGEIVELIVLYEPITLDMLTDYLLDFARIGKKDVVAYMGYGLFSYFDHNRSYLDRERLHNGQINIDARRLLLRAVEEHLTTVFHEIWDVYGLPPSMECNNWSSLDTRLKPLLDDLAKLGS